jgi:2-aminoethylphosphonate-pyruvate transaminase
MTVDLAPWDTGVRRLYAGVRERVSAIASAWPGVHTALVLQGCGHFGMEAALRSLVPRGGRILVPMTGAYAERLVRLAREAGRVAVELPIVDAIPVRAVDVAAALAADALLSHVALIHSETGTGVVHDPVAIGQVVRAAGRRMILDAVSAFGALPLDVGAMPELDVAVFTSNKCLEGLPGLSCAVARIDRLEAGAGQADSWSFDLADIHAQFRRNGPGSFRFTPPAQVLAALDVALDLHAAEGGQAARLARYRENARVLYEGMLALDLRPCLAPEVQGPVVLNVHAPDDPAWNLQLFVEALKAREFLISNFHNTVGPSFRVGCIGAITPDDLRRFVSAADAALGELGIRHRSPGALSTP